MCVWVLILFQTYSRYEGFACLIDFFVFVFLFLSGAVLFFFFLGGEWVLRCNISPGKQSS